MAQYIPKPDDPVFVEGHTGRFVVFIINIPKMTADVRSTGGENLIIRGVPWAKLSYLDESQNALRIIREATEGR